MALGPLLVLRILPGVGCLRLGRAELLWDDKKRQNRDSSQEPWGSGGNACPSSGPCYLHNVDGGWSRIYHDWIKAIAQSVREDWEDAVVSWEHLEGRSHH